MKSVLHQAYEENARHLAYSKRSAGPFSPLHQLPVDPHLRSTPRSSRLLEGGDECGCMALVVRFLIWADRNSHR